MNYITPQGFRVLQDEFRQLFSVERPRVVETVAWAAGNGDRSENGDYIYGKRRLREIDRRLGWLKTRIELARVVDPKNAPRDKVAFGARVTVTFEDGGERTVQIVGEDEIQPEHNRISWKSPIAKALLGRMVGDEVEIHRPAGPVRAEIRAIEPGD